MGHLMKTILGVLLALLLFGCSSTPEFVKKDITLGMSINDVLLRWGQPSDKVVRQSSSGSQEIWTYQVYSADYYYSLYFENGVLSSVTNNLP